jgi:hypothetical protein
VPAEQLPIYLRDHLAAASAAIARCRSARDGNAGNELGAFLERLVREIQEDREALLGVLARLGIAPSRVKAAVARAAERVGRLKPNGQLTGYSPLGRLLDLEVLALGLHGKQALWLALRELDDPRLSGLDFTALAERAQRQRDELEEHRRAVARIALR